MRHLRLTRYVSKGLRNVAELTNGKGANEAGVTRELLQTLPKKEILALILWSSVKGRGRVLRRATERWLTSTYRTIKS